MTTTLITGTSTGLGQATALHLARKGHTVYATMRSPERGGAPLLDAAKAEGIDIRVSALDVCDPAAIKRPSTRSFAMPGRSTCWSTTPAAATSAR